MLDAGPASFVLRAADVTHRYGGILALQEVSLDLPRHGYLAVLGSNGAGKSTLGAIISGMIRPTSGRITLNGTDVVGGKPLISRGVCLIPEGRRLFGQLTIAENLLLGGYGAGLAAAQIRARMPDVLDLMPQGVRDNRHRAAATLSGGERQMLAIGRALMADPRILIIDEPSMGLAPILVDRVYHVLDRLHDRGVAIVLIEQIATHARQHASAIVILDRGRVIYAGAPTGEAADAALRTGYVGSTD